MMYLITHLWVWLLIALIIGLVVGWMTCGNEPTRWWTGWIPWGSAAFLIGLMAAVLKLLPNRAGYLLDTGLLLFGTYIIGCCIGCLIKQWLAGGKDASGLATAAVGAGAGGAALKQASASPVAARQAAPVSHAGSGASGHAAASASAAAAPAPVATSAAAAPAEKPAVTPAVAQPAPLMAAPAAKPAEPDYGPEPVVEVPEGIVGKRPRGYAAPIGGKADDLKRIRGIGKQNEGRLHALGIWHFSQIAAWVREEIDWVGSYLAFPGRIDREDWVGQAKVLATGAETAFSKRVDAGEVATSRDEGGKGHDNVADLSKIDNATPKPKG